MEAAGVDLMQVVDDGDLDVVFEVGELLGLSQQCVVGEGGNGGGDHSNGVGSHVLIYINK